MFLDEPQSHDLIHHPAVQTLSRAIDMQNTCGYITLLNPHLTSRTETDVEETASMFQFTGDPVGELFSTNSEPVLGTENKEYDITQSRNGDRDKNFEDWCLLDMHFGLPLFDATLNQAISSKVCSFPFKK